MIVSTATCTLGWLTKCGLLLRSSDPRGAPRPGLEELIRALLRKDPEARPALRDVLADPLIQPARERVTQKSAAPEKAEMPSHSHQGGV